jgi:RNA polymerase sigma-70 factor (ECF subfamily)
MDGSLQHEGILQQMKARKSDNKSNDALTSSFESLFHEYWAPIYRLSLRLVVDPAEAEDLTLETFFRLYQRHPIPEEEFNARGWLQKVATNLALHSIRSFKRRQRYEVTAGRDALEQAPENQPPELFSEKQDHNFARLALAQMNPRQAGILVMRYSGMAYKDIAAILNLSPTSIGPLLLRAERDFKKRYRTLVEEEK